MKAVNRCIDNYSASEIRKGFWWQTGEQLASATAVALAVAAAALLIFHASYVMPTVIRVSFFAVKWTMRGAILFFALGLLSHGWSILAGLVNRRAQEQLTRPQRPAILHV